ncbi:MAG: hypothetical protein H0X26_05690 [Alphaproteobacteria bacterium]|nr:hypothetical protein [Alphaproteobacteria bacterium]
MKLSKFILLGAGVVVTMSSFSVSAVTHEELVYVIRTARTCPAATTLKNEPLVEQGRLSTLQHSVRKGLHSLAQYLSAKN